MQLNVWSTYEHKIMKRFTSTSKIAAPALWYKSHKHLAKPFMC